MSSTASAPPAIRPADFLGLDALLDDEERMIRETVLPEAATLRGPLSCLNEARYGLVWGAAGAARACYEAALAYSATRVQFGRPIAGFQLVQAKVAMALEVNARRSSRCTSGA
jgi:glutaryl-CoA dehydrogenase